MSDSLGSFGDFLPQQDIPCRVRGCKNHVHISGERAMFTAAHGQSRPKLMCDECYAKYQTLEDKEVPCSKPGCDGTWVWTRIKQLESQMLGHTTPPRGFCDKCRKEMESVQDIQVPCRLKGCKNTWTLTARAQMELNGASAPHRLCDECYHTLNTLHDTELKCRISGCDHTVTWTRYQQLEHLKAGLSLDKPPLRMCNRCLQIFRELKPIEVPCRVNGCKNTWTYNPMDQVEQIVKAIAAGKTPADYPKAEKAEKPAEPAPVAETPETPAENAPATEEAPAPAPAEAKPEVPPKKKSILDELPVPPPPYRMCETCFAFFNGTKDVQLPCRNHACKNTWTWSRSMQVEAKAKNRVHPPTHFCPDCRKKIETLQDQEMPCCEQGCKHTWTYSKEEQLHDQTAGLQPKPRRCEHCKQYLAEHSSKEVTCSDCGKTFFVGSHQQLRAELGAEPLPTLCADCIRKKLDQTIRTDAELDSIKRPVIYIPKAGNWQEPPPARITEEVIAQTSTATARVVCLGDELTLSTEDIATSWPVRLAEKLQERCRATSVVNAGISGSTTALCLSRLERDVLPFKPQVVIFSAVFADALAWPKSPEQSTAYAEKLAADTEALLKALTEAGVKVVCWLPQPISCEEPSLAANLDSATASLRKAANAAGTILVDAKTYCNAFDETAFKRWMADWKQFNAEGADKLANWLKDAIVSAGCLNNAKPLNDIS
ncbi:MAG: hypothetical protein IJJ26_04490 [Victivallales bacterium]|nr:hypothetical protein [Victivallales bacterium]